MADERLDPGEQKMLDIFDGVDANAPVKVVVSAFEQALGKMKGLLEKLKDETLEPGPKKELVDQLKVASELFAKNLEEGKQGKDEATVEGYEALMRLAKTFTEDVEQSPVQSTKTFLERVKHFFYSVGEGIQRHIITPFINFCKAVVAAISNVFKKAGKYMGFFQDPPAVDAGNMDNDATKEDEPAHDSSI